MEGGRTGSDMDWGRGIDLVWGQVGGRFRQCWEGKVQIMMRGEQVQKEMGLERGTG